MAGALAALGRFLRALLLALLLFLVFFTAPLFLPDLPVGVASLLEAFGWLLGGFWLLRGLSRLLFGTGSRPGLLLRNDPEVAARLRGATRFLLLLSLVLLPIHQALFHLAYANDGFTEALLLAYKVLVGLILVTVFLRRSLLLRLVPPAGSKAGRFLRLLISLFQPIAVLLVPTLLLLDALRYDILAGLIASFSVIVIVVALLAGLLYRLAMMLFESRLHRPRTPERETKSAESALTVARFCFKVGFLLAGGWAVLALSGTSLEEARGFFDHPLPFVGAGEERPVTWWNLGVALLLFLFFVYLTRTVKLALQDLILPRTGMDKGLQYTITTLVGYVLLAVGTYVATKEVFDLTSLGYIVAALSVGIGFGLQEIVSNFISGIILLFERPLAGRGHGEGRRHRGDRAPDQHPRDDGADPGQRLYARAEPGVHQPERCELRLHRPEGAHAHPLRRRLRQRRLRGAPDRPRGGGGERARSRAARPRGALHGVRRQLPRFRDAALGGRSRRPAAHHERSLLRPTRGAPAPRHRDPLPAARPPPSVGGAAAARPDPPRPPRRPSAWIACAPTGT
ncbi:MAG: mechanosensitive ion channel [Planctomycetes bacterium]|nr:mechanosensitive ion channel [Planctomycetota bacterium]